MTPEGKVKAMVKRQMEAAFPDAYRFMAVQNGMGAPALDFYYCVYGYWVAIETKAPGGWYTPRQEHTRDEIRKAGGLVFLVDGNLSMKSAINFIKNTRFTTYTRPLQTGEPQCP